MGFGGLVAEILLLRELMIVFSGNELSIGIILANWLLLEAIGCIYPGRWIDRIRGKLEAFALVTILFSVAFIAAIVFARILKNILGVSIGENIGLFPMFYSSLLILLPVSLLHGALFTFSCRIYALASDQEVSATQPSSQSRTSPPKEEDGLRDNTAGKVYIYETIGTITGGLACTFLLIPLLNTFQAAFVIAFLGMLSCLCMLIPTTRPFSVYLWKQNQTPAGLFAEPGPEGQNSRCQISVRILLTGLLMVTGYAVIGGPAEKLHQQTIRMQWKNHQVVHYQNSRYGNITVLENQGQYLFFLDGIPEIITPVPDMLFVEEFVHLPLLAHPDPRSILILRGGAGGVINEALTHPSVRTLRYAEHDPLLIDIIAMFATPLTESELQDERVTVTLRDGRRYLATTADRYDVIFIGVSEPSNLQANRFFTQEFFQLARERLHEGGVVVFTAPGSLTFLSEELKNLNRTLYHTFNSVFEHVRPVPGDGHYLYMGSESSEIRDLDLSVVIKRLKERALPAEAMVPWHIEKKLHTGWQQWFHDFIGEDPPALNRDFRPLGLYYHITHWNSLYAPSFGRYFNRLEELTPRRALSFLILLPLIAGIPAVLRIGRRPVDLMAVPFALLTTGFSGMIFSLIVIFQFQIIFGHVFSWIGLLVAAFMAGAAAGAMIATRITEHRKAREFAYVKKTFIGSEGVLIAFIILLPPLLGTIHLLPANPFTLFFFRLLFLAISFAGGLLVGVQYPLANRLSLKDTGGLSKTAGMLFASDLLGGWLGGILGAVVLLPVLGLTGTCLVAALLKVTSVIFVFSYLHSG